MIDQFHECVDKIAAAGHGLEAIEEIAKWGLEDEKRDSYEALHTIATIADTLRGMFQNKIPPEGAEEEIISLRSAQVGINHKFDQSEGPSK